jgi:DUF1707 SHOCT-like domain
MVGPGDEKAAAAGQGRGELRASHADREQVIGILKNAFVQGMLAKDEFDQRVSQAFASRTQVELVALTADLRVEPVAARRPEPAPAHGEQPVLRPGPVLAVATALYAAVWAFMIFPPWPRDSEGDLPFPVLLLTFMATCIYPCVMAIATGYMIAGWREKHSGGRPPRRSVPGPGGQVLRRPPSADAGGELPLADGSQQHTAEAARSRWHYRRRSYAISYACD